MFRDKYVYTCPDVIHIRQLAKKRARRLLIAQTLIFGALWLIGISWERKADAELAKDIENTPDQEN